MLWLLNDVLLPQLAAAGIRFLRRGTWNDEQRAWVHNYFTREVLPVLTPIGLDPAQVVEIRDLVGGLRGSRTVLFSSHILSELADFCTSIEPWPRGTSLFVTVQVAVPPSMSTMFAQPW